MIVGVLKRLQIMLEPKPKGVIVLFFKGSVLETHI